MKHSNVSDHLAAAPLVISDEDAATNHGFKTDTGLVLHRVAGLQVDVAVPVEFRLTDFVLVSCRPELPQENEIHPKESLQVLQL